jgi:gliding motility-associated-like protein
MGCDSTLILEVGFYPIGSPTISANSPSCHGAEDGSLKVLEPGSSFYWEGNSYADSLVLSSIGGGSYWITLLTADQCADTLLVWLSQPAPLEARILGLQNPYPYTGTAVTLNVNVTGGTPPYQYSWSSTPGLSCYDCPAPLAQDVEDALFRIQVMDAYGCDSQDSIQFRYLAEDYFIPSAFSPNGDGRNDVFLLYSKDANLTYELSIYDRWGAQIVQRINIPANDPNQGWNGNKNSQSLPAGVYPYLIRLSNGKILSGEVTLIR